MEINDSTTELLKEMIWKELRVSKKYTWYNDKNWNKIYIWDIVKFYFDEFEWIYCWNFDDADELVDYTEMIDLVVESKNWDIVLLDLDVCKWADIIRYNDCCVIIWCIDTKKNSKYLKTIKNNLY